jgi:Phosphatidylinositol-4-phosphate 5-Kinase
MLDLISRSKERRIELSIQRPFKYPLPPESKSYPYDKPAPPLSFLSFLHALLTEFLTIFSVHLQFNAPTLFLSLRQKWDINEEDYRSSFQQPLITLSGPLGFSGASFFETNNQKYLIKSINRGFEWRFFYDYLLIPLSSYQLTHPNSKICRITDALYNFSPRLGRYLRSCSSNFLVMVNEKTGDEWETFDLKPTNYFFPERDFLGGMLTSEKTKEKLHDEFQGEIGLKRKDYDELLSQLEEDSKFLEEMEAIDYSLFVLRRKCGEVKGTFFVLEANVDGAEVIIDAEGKWEYKFTILDFFTSTKMMRTKAMRFGVGMLGHGDMTITAPVLV